MFLKDKFWDAGETRYIFQLLVLKLRVINVVLSKLVCTKQNVRNLISICLCLAFSNMSCLCWSKILLTLQFIPLGKAQERCYRSLRLLRIPQNDSIHSLYFSLLWLYQDLWSLTLRYQGLITSLLLSSFYPPLIASYFPLTISLPFYPDLSPLLTP